MKTVRQQSKPIAAAILAILLSTLIPSQAQRVCVTIACPRDITAECTSPKGAAVNFNVAASNSCGFKTDVTCVPASGSTFPIGVTAVNCVAVDVQNNRATCAFKITVRDTTPPVIETEDLVFEECMNATIANGKPGAVVNYTVLATDACGPVTLSCEPPSGSIFPMGFTDVTCTAKDTAGNVSTKKFPVAVQDTSSPVFILPRIIQAKCESPQGAIVHYEAKADDLCGKVVLFECTPPSGSLFPMGITEVVCLAKDEYGNSNNGKFQVQVSTDCAKDCLKIACPTDITVECDSPAGTVVTYEAKAESSCGDKVTLKCSPPSGSLFPPGETTVVCDTGDTRGNQQRCLFKVKVVDTAKPNLECPPSLSLKAEPSALTANLKCRGIMPRIEAKATDNCTPSEKIQITQDPKAGAELGLGVNVATVTACDTSGNCTSCKVLVTVLDTTPPSLTLPTDITTICPQQDRIVVHYLVSAIDDCDPAPKVTCQPPSGSSFPVGTTQVICTATDASGNVSTGVTGG